MVWTGITLRSKCLSTSRDYVDNVTLPTLWITCKIVELVEKWITCPYCGEDWIALADPSAGSADYVEDCTVCCRPILFHMEVDVDGGLKMLIPVREDE